jgi:uncharacterized protein YkwD
MRIFSRIEICRAGTGLLTALFLAACAAGGNTPPKPVEVARALPAEASRQASLDTPLGRALLAEINNRRPDAPFTLDPVLNKAAAVHSADMKTRGFMGHHNPDGQGPLDRVLSVDEDFQGRVAENVGEFKFPPGESEAEKAAYMVEQWMNSPRHAAPLRSRAYQRTGIGIAVSGDRVYATQLFTGP